MEIDPINLSVAEQLPQVRVSHRENSASAAAEGTFPSQKTVPFERLSDLQPDYLLINGNIHYERDIQRLLSELRCCCSENTRLLLTYYSSMWRPLAALASRFGLRQKAPESNWLAHEDVANLLQLEGFELVRIDHKILLPFYVPILSNLINRYLAPLPLFNAFCLLNIAVARPTGHGFGDKRPSVSIVVPARNEAGNVDAIIGRIPPMGPDDEIIFVEGNSTDDTWATIKTAQARHADKNIVIAQQSGKGKGDAVRKGFDMARNEILMILDADMTVAPEELPKFYRALVENKGEFINGTRLVYPMEKQAMRFFNLLGNKFFALAFSCVLGQRFKDTLCGTKVLTRANYRKLAANRSYFGEFDPFGDFDLLFGAARMGLKIVEVPISYRERTYGETNISRWRHGALLLAMLMFAARRIKFL